MATPGQQFYKEQIDYILAKDVDGLIDNHYNEDAVLISFDATVKGRADLKTYFRGYLARLGHFVLESTDKYTETEDTIFLEATVSTDLGRTRVFDAFVLKGGKASYHFTGVIA